MNFAKNDKDLRGSLVGRVGPIFLSLSNVYGKLPSLLIILNVAGQLHPGTKSITAHLLQDEFYSLSRQIG